MNRHLASWQETNTTGYTISALEAVKSFLLILGFTFLTALLAQVHLPLPFTPVPITMQTLAVLLAGAFLGPWRGGISQLLYLLWGVSGLPLFAGASTGLLILAGPTGGYILGFILAALFIGSAIRSAKGTFRIAMIFTLGTAMILLAGWIHLTLFYTGMNMATAMTLGVLPFLPGAAVKIAAATFITIALKPSKR